MADYTQNTDFSVKDTLPADDPEKIILGADVDEEFTRIATAIQSKYDDTDVASQAEAQAETLNTKLMTPLRVANWADANAGIVGDLQALADPNADRLLGWDDSAGAAAGFTVGSGLKTTATPGLEVDIDNLTLSTPVGGDGIMIYDNDLGINRKATISSILAIGAPASNLVYKYLTTAQTINTTTPTAITGFSYTTPSETGYYSVEILLVLQNFTSQVLQFNLDPADPVDNLRGGIVSVVPGASTYEGYFSQLTTTSSGAPPASPETVIFVNGSFTIGSTLRVSATLKTIATNVIVPKISSYTTANSFQVLPGSWAKYEKLS
jgi:hypothetical protein